MKHTPAILTAILAFAASTFAQSNPLPNKAELLAAIETFSRSPLSADGKTAGDSLMRFVADPRCTNYVFGAMFPEFHVSSRQEPDVSKEIINTLNHASIAGNLRPQLATGEKVNHPYEGLQQMVKTYAQLMAEDNSLKIAKLEKFAALEAKGQLKQYVEDIVKKKNYPRTLAEQLNRKKT